MTRYRLVRETVRAHARPDKHVDSTVLTLDEIWDMLDWEAQLHAAGGWNVTRIGQMVRAEKPDCVRWLYVRARGPMEDTLT